MRAPCRARRPLCIRTSNQGVAVCPDPEASALRSQRGGEHLLIEAITHSGRIGQADPARHGAQRFGHDEIAPLERDIGQVVEGVYAAEAVHTLAHRLKVDMPITEQIYRILYAELSPRTAVETLMTRNLKAE